jgi:flagellar hook assembly protein FlgD
MAVTVDIYDVSGRRVRTLSAPGNPGPQTLTWDLKNTYGHRVASGVYVLRMWSSLQVQPGPEAVAYLAVLQ